MKLNSPEKDNLRFNKRWPLVIDGVFWIFVTGIVLYAISFLMIIISKDLMSDSAVLKDILLSSTFRFIVSLLSGLSEIAYLFLLIILFILWQKRRLAKRFRVYWIIVLVWLLPELYFWFLMIVFMFSGFNLQF